MATNIQIHRVDDATWSGYRHEFVYKALRDPRAYVRWRNGEVKKLQKQIRESPADSDAVDGYKWLLDSLVKSSPPGPTVPTSEPVGLHHLVYCQIEYLKRLRTAWFVTESVERSIDAALHAYRTGQLQAQPGLMSYWWNGQMTRGPAPEPVDDLAECAEEWTRMYGKGQVHIERLSQEWAPQQASVAVYPPRPAPEGQIPPPAIHMIGVKVTLPDIPDSEAETQFTVLDDTGSNFLELFGADCAALGFDPRVIPPKIYVGVIDLTTVNGMVSVPCIKVGLQFLGPDDEEIGDVISAMAVCANDWYAIRERCSGQALRSALFTATAPQHIGGGDMVIGTHKSIVMNTLPGRARP